MDKQYGHMFAHRLKITIYLTLGLTFQQLHLSYYLNYNHINVLIHKSYKKYTNFPFIHSCF